MVLPILFGGYSTAYAAILYQQTGYPVITGSTFNNTIQATSPDFSGVIKTFTIYAYRTDNTEDNTTWQVQLYNQSGSLVNCLSDILTMSERGVPITNNFASSSPITFIMSGSECEQTFSFVGGISIFENSPEIVSVRYAIGNVSQLAMKIENNFPTGRIDTFSYSTTTAVANITGYWEATTTPHITQRLSFWQFSNTLGRESYEQITATTTGYFNFSFPFLDPYAWTATSSTTTAPIYNSFTLNASLDEYDETNYVFPYGGTIINNLDATSTEVSAVSQYNADDFTLNPRQLALYPEYECGITSLTGCFKNAIIWAFYPTQETLDNWNSLLTTIQTKAPVGYFFMTRDSISGLSATSTKAFNVVIPSSLKTYIFNPFDTGIAAILWFFFIFNFYKRLKTITI